MSGEMITITKKEYDELIKRDNWLLCLENAGVDNWEGFCFAKDLQEQYAKETK
jgi:hypothetical protein